MITSLITALGLTPMEAECYETLLKSGTVPMSELTSSLKRHPQVVYRLIDQLRIKGLVLTETRLHRKFVRAEDPKIIELKETEKLKVVQRMIPALLAIQNEPKEAKVHVERGMEATLNLRRRAYEQLSDGQTYDILSPSLAYYSGMKASDIHEIERFREKRKVRKRMLVLSSDYDAIKKNERWKNVEIRTLSEVYSVPTSTNIFGSTVYIQIWSHNTIVIVIESAEVSQSYRDFFETLWKKGVSH